MSPRIPLGPSLPPGLYGMADAAFGDPLVLALALAEGGCRVVQLRAKAWSSPQRARAATALVLALRPRGVRLLVNDDVDAAALAGADGVHLGQDDGDIATARARLGPGALIGRSTHSLAQVARAAAEGADYLGFGPVFPTRTKADADRVVGLDGLRAAVAATSLPVVAIGGIDRDRLPELRRTGVHGWAVVSALLEAARAGAEALSAEARRYA